MSKQPEALRLADSLWALMSTVYSNGTLEASAAELRRLHAANMDCMAWYKTAKSERDALLEALETNNQAWKNLADSGDAGFWEAEEQPFYETSVKAITALRAALAEPTVKESLQVESAVAEIATTQQQLDNKPPSDYRRGYWDGFAIGKREGRIEAEDALAEPVQKPVAWSFEARHIDTAFGPAVSIRHPGREHKYMRNLKPLYTAPPQRKPLTEEEIDSIWDSEKAFADIYAIVRAIERAHGIT